MSSALAAIQARYDQFKAMDLKLDMTRGKPAPAQLDLAGSMLTTVTADSYTSPGGTDCRNYGVLDGLPEARAFFADYMDVAPNEVIIGGNASLSLMYEAVTRAMLHGVPDGDGPWPRQETKFLCPSPGYDRHFNICANLGITMITVDLNEDGPDMEQVRKLVAEDKNIKGMWCVPRYSNPTGISYSDAVIDQLASMETAAPDFRILWDNAYKAHHLTDEPTPQKSMLQACKEAGNPNRVLMFGSTSKITMAGGGISVIAASETNIGDALRHMFNQTIGHDKINQLRHLRFFGDMDGLRAHMKKHAAILKPKFDKVQEVLNRELGDSDTAVWTKPQGGYFISLDTKPGLASRVVSLAAQAGVKLTAAGATFPYKKDPNDCNIRIAPSFPDLPSLEKATEVLAVCIQLATLEADS